MRKGLCTKCNRLINVDESVSAFECPECHEQINTLEAIKTYNRTVNYYKRKAEIALLGSTQYKKAYENYSKLYELAPEILTVLTGVSLSRLYCSDLHNIYIKEATDILLKGSDKVEISDQNVKNLSEFLKKFKEDCFLIVQTLSQYKNESKYTYNLYIKSLNEFAYYLNAYLEIYKSLDKLNSHFVEGPKEIDEANKFVKKHLEEKITLKSESEEKFKFINKKGKQFTNIFPDKKKIYIARMCLYGGMGVGFICSLVGLIMLSTSQDKVVPGILAAIGIAFFIAGYFIGNYLRRKNYGTNY